MDNGAGRGVTAIVVGAVTAAVWCGDGGWGHCLFALLLNMPHGPPAPVLARPKKTAQPNAAHPNPAQPD